MDDRSETTRTAGADGVRVRKTVDVGPDESVVVTLQVDVESEEPTTVRITEPGLAAIPPDDLELHTHHGAEHWHVGEEATFEREFAAGESYEVVYRVIDVGPDRFGRLDEDPVVESVGGSVEDLVDREGSRAVRQFVAGERESLAATVPGAGGVELSLESDHDDQASGHPDDQVPPSTAASTGGPNDSSSTDEISVDPAGTELPVEEADEAEVDESGADDAEAASPSADSGTGESTIDDHTDGPSYGGDSGKGPTGDSPETDDSRTDDLAASLAATPSGGLARVLLEELREGHVDDDIREAIREELEAGRSRDVRIEHLQSRVTEFAAYVEMFDEFVDEHGTLEDALGGVDQEMETLEEEVGTLDEGMEALDEEVGTLDEGMEALDEEVGTLEEEVGTVRSELDDHSEAVSEDVRALESDVDGVRAGQDDLADRIDGLEAQLGRMDDRLDEFEAFTERLSGAVQGVGGSDQ